MALWSLGFSSSRLWTRARHSTFVWGQGWLAILRRCLRVREDIRTKESVKTDGKWGFLEVLMWFGRKEDVWFLIMRERVVWGYRPNNNSN